MANKGSRLSHLDESGAARMVDISAKEISDRYAVARGALRLSSETLAMVVRGDCAKGDVFATARLAAIMAAKRTHELIPLCHPLALQAIEIDFSIDYEAPAIFVTACVSVGAKTGVEMEALTAVSIACLTLYDMIKGVERGAHIGSIYLLEKRGGKSGDWHAARSSGALGADER